MKFGVGVKLYDDVPAHARAMWSDGDAFGHKYSVKIGCKQFVEYVEEQEANGGLNTTSTVINLLKAIVFDQCHSVIVNQAFLALHHIVEQYPALKQKVDWPTVVYELGSLIFSDDAGASQSKLKESIAFICQNFSDFDISSTRDKDGINLLMYATNSVIVERDFYQHLLNLDPNVNASTERYGKVVHFLHPFDSNLMDKLKMLIELGADPNEQISYLHYDSIPDDCSPDEFNSLSEFLSSKSTIGGNFTQNIAEALELIQRHDRHLSAMAANEEHVESAEVRHVRIGRSI